MRKRRKRECRKRTKGEERKREKEVENRKIESRGEREKQMDATGVG